MLLLASFSILILLSTTGPAHAYLDPGTGSLILQALIAGVAAALAAVKIFWLKITIFFGKIKNSFGGADSPQDNGDGDT
ncbi:MAG: hypothetical protein HND56_09445 [Pseudomonadota bacterium]|nr:hypothetical protein [Pseudomonadota bacterium]QKK04155.1 MAG: hypothetical protein HND56_09445 [Pseudomonadota bacterium]|tara:strand:+ start:1919 stop:2155 length:237 start_codon:yes stop_codon:yes gene_type:complete